MLFDEQVYRFMFAALAEAEKALEIDEVPIGAVVVHENKIIGKGFNQTELLKDSAAHAEMLAITAASNHLQNKLLENCTLYVTAEPCLMCAGAILLSRIPIVYFGAHEPKFGAAGSIFNVLESGKYNHSVKVYSGIYAQESQFMLKNFFENKRIPNPDKQN
ncbi:MAG: tRNA adenosine(34) deaminase TadA [bacterium]